MALSTVGEMRKALAEYHDDVALAIVTEIRSHGEWTVEDEGECGVEIVGA